MSCYNTILKFEKDFFVALFYGLPLKKTSMQFPSPVSVQWLAEFVGAELVGNPGRQPELMKYIK